MQLSSTLAWLVDEVGVSPDPDWFQVELGARLIEDGLPLVGGALSLAAPHLLIEGIAARAFVTSSAIGTPARHGQADVGARRRDRRVSDPKGSFEQRARGCLPLAEHGYPSGVFVLR
jgi:hypothetical protein